MGKDIPTTITRCRVKIKRLDDSIKKAEAEVNRLNNLRHKTKIALAKAEARDFVLHNKQYIGKWVAADAPKIGKWSGTTIYLKPMKFIYEAGLNCTRVYVVGIIAFRYNRPNCYHGWQLWGDLDHAGHICVFGSKFGVTLRPATERELSRNHMLIFNSEKIAKERWGITADPRNPHNQVR